MKQYFIFIALMLVVFACSESSDNSKPSKQVDGSHIYTQYCVICHGKDGTQQLNGAFKLPESKLTLEERINIITNGRKLMTPFKGLLKEKEIEAVAAYTMRLKAAN